jgi:CBS domain-containing protein
MKTRLTHTTRQGNGCIRHHSAPPLPEAKPRRRGSTAAEGRLDELTARDLMTPGVVSIVDDASMHAGFEALSANRGRAILVVEPTAGRPLGWVTDRGLLAHLECEPKLTLIRSAITEEVVSVTPGTTARHVVGLLSHPETSHVLVANAAGRFPEGVISALDLVRTARP